MEVPGARRGSDVLAALTNACGSKSGPVRATWSAVSRSSTGRSLPADPRAVVVEQHLAHGQRRDDRESRGARARPPARSPLRRRIAGVKYAPAARTTTSASIRSPAVVSTPIARLAVQDEPVDRRARRGRSGSASQRAGSRYANAAFQRVPSTTFAGKRRPPDGLRRVVRVVEQRKPRVTRRLEERDVERRRLGRVRRPTTRSDVARPGEVGREATRTTSRGPIRRSRRASRRPPCRRCASSSRRSRAHRASGRPRRPCPSRA